MNDQNPISFSRQFRPPGMTGLTAAPQNVDQEPDSPPGAPDYVNGPLAMPRPTPRPPPTTSLTTLADGGFNHAQAWMSGSPAPQRAIEQQPFNAIDPDVPPGAPDYASGPLANPPKPSPTPSMAPDVLKRFSFSSAFDQTAY